MSFLDTSKITQRIRELVSRLTQANQLADIQLLEPLSIIIKLAVISYKKVHTKIAVSNNRLFIQNPNAYQGVIRYMYGNNREDICFLLKPILRTIELYAPRDDPQLKYIFLKAIDGLYILKKSYYNESSTVCHSLDLYISIMKSHLKSENIYIESYKQSQDLNLSVSTQVNLEKIFQNIWSESDILLLYSMFKAADDDPLVCKTYIDSIENLIQSKAPIIHDRISKTKKII
tara:strand:+ start:3227 stop:3919 length:693 start_codon:yes stop_codon:yes gene_type:complete